MRFCAKKLRKSKMSFHSQLSQKKKKTHCVSCAKIAQKFAKKNLRERFSHFVETLPLMLTCNLLKTPETSSKLYKIHARLHCLGNLVLNKKKKQFIFWITFFKTKSKKEGWIFCIFFLSNHAVHSAINQFPQ